MKLNPHGIYLSIFGVMLSTSMPAMAENVHISTPSSSLVIEAVKGEQPHFLYYGAAVTPADIDALAAAGAPRLNAYPTYGINPEHEAALAVTHADGNMTLDPVVESRAGCGTHMVCRQARPTRSTRHGPRHMALYS